MSAEGQTVVLIHGMWMTPRSWDNWVDHYRDRGYKAIAPGWPGVKDPEETRRDPSGLKGLRLTQIVDAGVAAGEFAPHDPALVAEVLLAVPQHPRAVDFVLDGLRAR